MDILCQAKSGKGKTEVFVLATLQQLGVIDKKVYALVMCHERIGVSNQQGIRTIFQTKFVELVVYSLWRNAGNNCPHVVVGTPCRILALVLLKKLDLQHLKRLKMFGALGILL
jgi:ATP-dependent RNA helicase UAP56/SUB2